MRRALFCLHFENESKMPRFRVIRECLLLAHQQEILDDEEFILLHNQFKSENLDFPYWKYSYFDLDQLTDDECQAEFRFLKNDIYTLREV